MHKLCCIFYLCVQSSEGDLQTALVEMYAKMNEETFRAMRRIRIMHSASREQR